jgi:hypothetical protein
VPLRTVVAALAAVAVLSPPVPATAAPTATEPPNLVANGTVALDAAGNPDGWDCDPEVQGRYLSPGAEFTHVGPRDGDTTDLVRTLAGSTPADPGEFSWLEGAPTNTSTAACSQRVPVRPNSWYTLSASVNGGMAFLATDYGTVWTPPSEDWTALTTRFHTGPTTITVRIAVHGWYAGSPYNADDVVLTGPGGTVVAPRRPTGLTASRETSRSLQLTWTGSPGTIRYRVYRDGALVATVAQPRVILGDLVPGQRHTFTVNAGDPAGWSAPSAPLTPAGVPVYAQAPAAPVAEAVQWTPTMLVLSIDPADTVTDGYYVYVDGVRIGWALEREVSVDLPDAAPHRVQVSALNAAGESPLSAPLVPTEPNDN